MLSRYALAECIIFYQLLYSLKVNGWVESLKDTPPEGEEENNDNEEDTVATLPLSTEGDTAALFTSDGKTLVYTCAHVYIITGL